MPTRSARGTRKRSRFRRPRRNRFIGFYQWAHKPEEGERADELVAYESREAGRPSSRAMPKVEWQGVRGNSLIASLQFGVCAAIRRRRYLDGTGVGRSDLDTERVTGENVVAGETQSTATANHTKGSLTWYKPNWFHGNHEFKVGFDHSSTTSKLPDAGRRDRSTTICCTTTGYPSSSRSSTTRRIRTAGRDVSGHLREGQLDRRAPADAESGAAVRPRHAVCARAVPRGRGASLGRRLPRPVLRQGASSPIWNSVAPRLHAAYDLVGRWQDRDQGRVGTLRPHAPAQPGRASG